MTKRSPSIRRTYTKVGKHADHPCPQCLRIMVAQPDGSWACPKHGKAGQTMKPGTIFRERGDTAEEAVRATVDKIATMFPDSYARTIVRKIEWDRFDVPLDHPFWECIIELPAKDAL